MSGSGPAASGSERALFYGYRNSPVPKPPREITFMKLREGCVCGLVIVSPNRSDAIRRAVKLHNATREHEAWRKREGV